MDNNYNNDNLEQFLKKKLQEDSVQQDDWFTPSDSIWDNIAPEIEPPKPIWKRFIFWQSLTLALVLLLSSLLFINRNLNQKLTELETQNSASSSIEPPAKAFIAADLQSHKEIDNEADARAHQSQKDIDNTDNATQNTTEASEMQQTTFKILTPVNTTKTNETAIEEVVPNQITRGNTNNNSNLITTNNQLEENQNAVSFSIETPIVATHKTAYIGNQYAEKSTPSLGVQTTDKLTEVGDELTLHKAFIPSHIKNYNFTHKAFTIAPILLVPVNSIPTLALSLKANVMNLLVKDMEQIDLKTQRKNGLQFGIRYSTLLYAMRMTGTTHNELSSVTDYDKARVGHAVGMTVGIPVHRNWTLESGLYYNAIRNQSVSQGQIAYDTSSEYVMNDITNNDIAIDMQTPLGNVSGMETIESSVNEPISDQEMILTTVRYHQNIQTLSIPLKMNRHFRLGTNFRPSIGAGISYHIPLQQQTEYSYSVTRSSQILKNATGEISEFSKMIQSYMSADMQASIAYQPGQKLNFRFGFGYHYGLTPIANQEGIKTFTTGFQSNIGIFVKF